MWNFIKRKHEDNVNPPKPVKNNHDKGAHGGEMLCYGLLTLANGKLQWNGCLTMQEAVTYLQDLIQQNPDSESQ